MNAQKTAPPLRRNRCRGAALLLAMLTVTLVATFASAALWRQWRGVEVETAERARVQAGWILVGAVDWSRVILREDARASGIDHLDEPWAVPLQEARLSTFLAADAGGTASADAGDAAQDTFLSGRMIDLQSRMNVYNIADGGQRQDAALRQFQRLFAQLGLPEGELELLARNLVRAQSSASGDADAPLMPQKFEQLTWLGLSPATLRALAPYATLLPLRTRVNINTASAEVLQASAAGLDRAGAELLVQARRSDHFRNLAAAGKLVGGDTVLPDTDFGVASMFFEARGRLRLGGVAVEERSVLRRDGATVRTLWRERGAIGGMDADILAR
ncbi:type II secretion system minor pseudopilin GspK [Ramlibacter sp. H39-3-26]|uniref:type II secretion system minor pseudopilin GspK n=1 Tax=Curvibacter soli TaxID=3031331 RepID=UPI0023DAB1B5|nr:type II secretion system minor pseudopilin GspK [Ramlibacter sp. H39-3-26]MDF1483722.1 type II secretion system minor pseudopilin GspK [Ramlibacter sp. H39-3-26]